MITILLLMALLSPSVEARGTLVTVQGTTTVTLINPPQPVACGDHVWDFRYTPSGQVFRSTAAMYHPTEQLLEVVPAVDQCVFTDGFEDLT